RTQQSTGKETRFEVAPRLQNVLRVELRSRLCVLLFPTLSVTDRQYTLETVFAVQYVVADVHRQIVFKPRRVVAQNLIEINGAWRLKERGHELFGADAQFVDHIVRRSLYPTNVEAKAFGDIKQIFNSQIQAFQADI